MSKVVYQIDGKEQEQLKQALAQIVSMQNAFFDIVTFIGKREGVDFAKVKFDQDKLIFVEAEEVKKE